MSRAKTERLLNLVICLLDTRRFLTKEQIRQAVPGYPDSDEAFARSFERDKDELREMGLPVETGTNSALFDDEVGYRIRRDAYALPEVSFTAEEMSVLALATRAWQSSALAGQATRALVKLKADSSDEPVTTLGPTLTGIEARIEDNPLAFAPLWQAVQHHQPVRFGYRRPSDLTEQVRTVEPWGLVAARGRWYLVGFDRDRGDRRVFRLSRMSEHPPVTAFGEPGEVVIPAGVDLTAEVAAFDGPAATQHARVALRPGCGGFLRRRASAVTEASFPAPAGEGPPWDEVVLPYADTDQLASEVAGVGPDAVVREPKSVRQLVTKQLQSVLDSLGGGK